MSYRAFHLFLPLNFLNPFMIYEEQMLKSIVYFATNTAVYKQEKQ